MRFESYNFGAGGYNTSNELFTLRNAALNYKPDMIIIGYTMGDAEPPLFKRDALTGNISRNPVEESLGEGLADSNPPDKSLYKLRIAKLWAHPTDQHPNDIVHMAAAEAIIEKVERDHIFPENLK